MIGVAKAINSFLPTEQQADFVPAFKTALELTRTEPSDQCLDPKKLFELLELIAVDILSPILEHEAVDKESREIARDLRSLPDYLQSYLGKGMMGYPDAIEELSPKIIEAKDKLLQKKRPRAAETREEHRARLLIDKLESLEIIRISQAIKIIHIDEGKKPAYAIVRRAMKKASEISPNAVFINGCNDGLGAVLRWKEVGAENYVAWYV
jgi:hypothetical protein